MKSVIYFLAILCGYTAAAQELPTRYYEASGESTTKEKAAFYAEFRKSGDVYVCTSYVAKSGVLRGIATYSDTAFTKTIGVRTLYFANGRLEDSAVFDADGKPQEAWHYYPNKVMAAHYHYPANATEPVVEGFDENGKRIKNYVLMQEAAFKGGDKGWNAYLSKSLSKDLFNMKDGTEATVSLKVQFVVDEAGYVIRPKVLESSGHRNVDGEALRVILSSPQWSPALLYNKPVKAYRVQPFTYVLGATKTKQP